MLLVRVLVLTLSLALLLYSVQQSGNASGVVSTLWKIACFLAGGAAIWATGILGASSHSRTRSSRWQE